MVISDHGRRQWGAVAPLVFIHGMDIVDRGLIVLFFGLFSVASSYPLENFLPTPLSQNASFLTQQPLLDEKKIFFICKHIQSNVSDLISQCMLQIGPVNVLFLKRSFTLVSIAWCVKCFWNIQITLLQHKCTFEKANIPLPTSQICRIVTTPDCPKMCYEIGVPWSFYSAKSTFAPCIIHSDSHFWSAVEIATEPVSVLLEKWQSFQKVEKCV